MAPFGKNFLKARMKNRAKDAAAGKEIQVSVCGDEKVVCGVTKHTTCADMVQALLEDQCGGSGGSCPSETRQGVAAAAAAEDFCLVERWKGFERALPPLTRILRLWHAWGDQRPFVRFLLVRSGDFTPQAARKGKPKGARAKRAERGRSQLDLHLHHQLPQLLPQAPPQPLAVERQKRMVKKAFRKLEKLHKENKSSRGRAAEEEIERMVQLILSQDHALREQAARMGELDGELRRVEWRRGAAALGGLAEVVEEEEEREEDQEEQLQALLHATEGLEQLELQLQEHQELILQLSRDIHAELTGASSSPSTSISPSSSISPSPSISSFFPTFPSPSPSPSPSSSPSCTWDAREEEVAMATTNAPSVTWLPQPGADRDAARLQCLRVELRRSLSAGVRLRAQTAALDAELRRRDDALASGDRECRRLAEQFCGLRVGAGGRTVVGGNLVVGGVTDLEAQATAKHGPFPADVTDTDSDTGFSSTHSQDSLSPGLDFPPPLDTDV